MRAFDYIAVETIAEACGVLAGHGPEAAILAGGTDLLIELRRAATKAPRVVLDISRVPELGGVGEADGSIAIKPLATHSELARSGLVQKFAPLLGSAAAAIGSPQIRGRGTVGGNIMNAAACADTVPPLIALGAMVTLQSKGSCRELALADLFVKPYQTKAKPDELLTEIRFPKLPPRARSAFIKLGRRNALSISRMSVAAVLQMGSDGRIVEARIVPGAAFPTWKRVPEAEQMLVGQKPGKELFAAAGRKVSEEMIKATGRRWSTEYKEPVIAVLVRRALEQCAANAGRGGAPASTNPSPRPSPLGKGRGGIVGGTVAMQGSLAEQARRAAPLSGKASRECRITTTINGRSHTLTISANRTLLDLLREDLGLLGTKCGCEIGECGACTVLLEGQPVNSCLVLAPQIDGREVLTVEGLAPDGKLHPLQESFLDHDAVHCGFCTPGMLLSAKALLDWNTRPTETEIRTAISGNLCRCTGYQQIVQAIDKASAAQPTTQAPRRRKAATKAN
jgi:xanthine dehydrogenase iron-sulfur cluster and FAD-binding subunit A